MRSVPREPSPRLIFDLPVSGAIDVRRSGNFRLGLSFSLSALNGAEEAMVAR